MANIVEALTDERKARWIEDALEVLGISSDLLIE
jgi:hypothetical protein